MPQMQSLLGFVFLIFLAWLCSENRRRMNPRILISGILLQFALAVVFLKIPFFQNLFFKLNYLTLLLEKGTTAGCSFVFGYLGGATPPFETTNPAESFILAFRALPILLLVSALSALLFYWRILPFIVRMFSLLLQRTMGIGGALGVGTGANIFVGMIEAPLFIRPYFKDLTRSELFTLMTTGMATIAGTMLALYASILRPVIPDSLGQILSASIISVPASILLAQIMIPETQEQTSGEVLPPEEANGTMDAIARGTVQGVQMLLPIVGMLIVLVGLVSIANQLLGFLPDIAGAPVTLQRMLGYVMAPVVWLIGIPWSEATTAGMLMGTKIILNELIAYIDLAKLPAHALSPRSQLIMTYALCGFANLGSLGIMIGGMGAMAPERRTEVAALGMRSIMAGAMATCMTGAVIGVLTW